MATKKVCPRHGAFDAHDLGGEPVDCPGCGREIRERRTFEGKGLLRRGPGRAGAGAKPEEA